MADSFVQNLRMGSIYNPFQGQNLPRYDPITEFATRILPLIHGEEDRGEAQKIKFMNMMRAQQADDRASQPMNTVLGQPPIKPLDMAKLAQNEEKIQSTRDIAGGKLGLASSKEQTDAAIRQQRADTYDYKIKNPNHVLNVGKDGVLRAFNPQTNEIEELGKTGLSQQEIADINQKNAKEIANLKATNATALEGQKQTGRLADIAARGVETRDTKQTPTPDKPLLPTQQRTQYRANAEKAIAEHPEWKDHIQLDPQGMGFSITPPGSGFFGTSGPDEDTYHSINSYIYGGGTDVNLPKDKSTKPTKSTTPKVNNDPLGIRPGGDDNNNNDESESSTTSDESE